MSILLLNGALPSDYVVPSSGAPDLAVGANFERFDGLSQPPLDHPAAQDPMYGGRGDVEAYGASPRPGQKNQPVGQEYTPGPISGVVGVVGGQPLPVAPWLYKQKVGAYTPSKTHSIQHRLGQGQAYQGVAQTVALSEITDNPPQPGDLTMILAGLG